MKNMEDLETMFISAKNAKINTNNYIHEREELYRNKAIDFLNKYNFNKVITKACEERRFSIPPIQIEESTLAYAVRDVLFSLGYTTRVNKLNNTYNINIDWGMR